jgi:hypothetical protein
MSELQDKLQAELNEKLVDHLEAIMKRMDDLEARLSSIVKLLSAESKPLSPSEYKAIWHGEVEQEPEWRPMSEAPRDMG